jgi:hypothetical protein
MSKHCIIAKWFYGLGRTIELLTRLASYAATNVQLYDRHIFGDVKLVSNLSYSRICQLGIACLYVPDSNDLAVPVPHHNVCSDTIIQSIAYDSA